MMFVTLIATVFLSMLPVENLSLNRKLQMYKEDQMEMGTLEEAEGAKKWPLRVYLPSYPRSGNHWIRYLIEEATGIATSSVYKDMDPPHLPTAFPWGGYCCEQGYEGTCRYPVKGEAIVIKTHFPTLSISRFDQLPYSLAIRIIRHPVDSFYSEYVWKMDFHEKTPQQLFPRADLRESIQSWRRFQEYWDLAENVLTIRYEDFYKHPALYLKLILERIGYQIDDAAIERAVTKYPPRGGILKHHKHFTREDLDIIQNRLGDLMEQYGYGLYAVYPLYP